MKHKPLLPVSERGSQKRSRNAMLEPPDSTNDFEFALHDSCVKVSKKSCQKAYAACDTCRGKKVKCNEGRPICSYCSHHGYRCIYPEGARPNNENLVGVLLDRFGQVEKTLEALRDKVNNQEQEPKFRKMKEYALARQGASTVKPIEKIAVAARSQLTTDCSDNFNTLDEKAIQSELFTQGRYSEKSPLQCEELRPPLPDLLSQNPAPPDARTLLPFVDEFLQLPYKLYPLICRNTAYKVSEAVKTKGFQPDLGSCLVLLMSGLAKAFVDPESRDSGLSDFQRANQILGRVNSPLSLEYVQVQLFTALFLLKKGLLLNYSTVLHTACTSFYTLVNRERISGIERPPNERNTMQSIYWITYNLERDLVNEIDETLPQSSLCMLEDMFPLPLGCDLSKNPNLPPRIRDELMFFLAEMSLRAIMVRVLTTPFLDDQPERSPLFQEFRKQFDEWELGLPQFLGWLRDPGRGVVSLVTTRIKLIYWFARFALLRPLMLCVLHDPTYRLQLLGWSLFQEGVAAAIALIKTAIWEEPEIDIMMGNRILSAIDVVYDSIQMGCLPTLNSNDVDDMLSAAVALLQDRVGKNSEWMACKLYNTKAIGLQ